MLQAELYANVTPLAPSFLFPWSAPSIQQVASALQYAHQQGVIHRDVKPQNMLLASNGNTIWLSDFGVTTIAHSEYSLSIQDMAGTVHYMAPEQLQRKPRPASDQYALGIVVYEWLTGTRPFTGSEVEIIAQHLHTPPPSLREKVPTLPPDVEAVVLQALSKEPQERFLDLDTFARALQEASQSAHSHLALLSSEASTPSSLIPSQLASATPSAHAVVPSVPSSPPHTSDSRRMPVPPENRAPQFPATVVPASNPSTHRSFTQPAIPQPTDTISPHHTIPDEKIAILTSDKSSQSRPIAHVPTTSPLSHRTRSRMTITLLLAGLALLLIVSSTFLYPMVLNNHFISPKATATLVHVTTPAKAFSTPTTQVGVNATLTTLTNNTTATATTLGNIFTTITSSPTALNDPLSDNTGNNGWDETNASVAGQCVFTNSTYHAIEARLGYLQPCFAESTNFSNFAYQVQMIVDKGNQGGLLFRATSSKGSFYFFRIGIDGSYALNLYKSATQATVLSQGFSAAITTGLTQSNQIAVIAIKDTFYFYANQQFVVALSDSTLTAGTIGVASLDTRAPTEIEFSNAQVWNVSNLSLTSTP